MESFAGLLKLYQAVRRQTLRLTENLSAEDMVVQSMPDASPSKWHLGHTSWFFEEFVLREHLDDYQSFDESYSHLFNSYYEAVGDRHPRPQRGLLTRPNLSSVLHYRAYVDSYMEKLLGERPDSLRNRIITGLHHEMQHQELLLTDILHLLSFNALSPAVYPSDDAPSSEPEPLGMQAYDGGLVQIGAARKGFSYDCEKPRHQVFLQPFRLAERPVSNREWLEFIAAGGYQQPLLWLSDGWQARQDNDWQAPLYWRQVGGEWHQFGLDGLRPLNFAAPVCHVSYYEADAYARWAGKRLPSEQEWEHAVGAAPVEGNFLEAASWRPGPAIGKAEIGQAYGDVWEWTRSPYMAYPGFKPESGALQEYNGKFMANQFVLRGGSCVTPRRQMRASYRNFFFPHQRWQFSGLRLAEDD
ncbi:MAG: ergothioneine biosynthesis protein EgtB [Cellvibrionaceae bacterium]